MTEDFDSPALSEFNIKNNKLNPNIFAAKLLINQSASPNKTTGNFAIDERKIKTYNMALNIVK